MGIEKVAKNVVSQLTQTVRTSVSAVSEPVVGKVTINGGEQLLSGSLECMSNIAQAQIGKHKIPRFLYHLTTREAYDSMIKDGYIKPTTIDLIFNGNSLFMFDMSNFLTSWGKTHHSGDLRRKLLDMVSRTGKVDVVLLKIPVRALRNWQSLKIRSQNKLLGTIELEDCADKAIAEGVDLKGAIHKALKEASPTSYTHVTAGAPAKYSSLYKQRSEPIEYIYSDNIPINIVQKLGEVRAGEIGDNSTIEFIKKLLQGTQEAGMCALLK